MSLVLRLASITKESIVDGPGIRYVLWSQGCKHLCFGCHNPSTHNFMGGLLYSIDDIIKDIKKNPLLKGITCSGGEPFEQAEAFAALCKKVKSLGLDIWCYTGYTFEFLLENLDHKPEWRNLLGHIDVLVDGPYKQDERDLLLLFRGSRNQRIIQVKESLASQTIILSNQYHPAAD